jgi:hypothetical protein
MKIPLLCRFGFHSNQKFVSGPRSMFTPPLPPNVKFISSDDEIHGEYCTKCRRFNVTSKCSIVLEVSPNASST